MFVRHLYFSWAVIVCFPKPQMAGTDKAPERVRIFFKTMKQMFPVCGVVGDTVLETAHKNDIGLEGACEGNLACSTCHVVLEDSLYKRLAEPSEKEYDLIDQAFGASSTSRLACQLRIDRGFDKAVFTIPKATRNMAVDGFQPKPH